MDFKRYIEIAKALKPNSDCHTVHATFIIKKKRLMAIGVNFPHKTHPKNLKYRYVRPSYKGTHSELSAVLKYGKEDCSDCIIVNIRVNRFGQMGYSKPCSGCSDLLRQVGFKKVYYTTKDGNFLEWDGK